MEPRGGRFGGFGGGEGDEETVFLWGDLRGKGRAIGKGMDEKVCWRSEVCGDCNGCVYGS